MPPSPFTPRVPDPVRLLPDLGAAAVWSFWAATLVAAAGWFVVDSFGHPLAWLGLGVAVSVLAWFAFQLVLPKRFQIILDPDVLWVRQAWRHLTMDWNEVYVVRVRHVLGDPILEVQRQGTDAATPGERTFVPLPVGTDIRPIHRFLAARLGHGALPRGRLEPLDPFPVDGASAPSVEPPPSPRGRERGPVPGDGASAPSVEPPPPPRGRERGLGR